MRSLLMAVLDRLRPVPRDTWVRLVYADGGAELLGPMDRYAAELLLVTRISDHPYHANRRVASARIIGGG